MEGDVQKSSHQKHTFANDRIKFSNDLRFLKFTYRNNVPYIYIKNKIDILNMLLTIKQTCIICKITRNI